MPSPREVGDERYALQIANDRSLIRDTLSPFISKMKRFNKISLLIWIND